MKRIHIHLTDVQLRKLRKLAGKSGRVAELIRRAIDEFLKGASNG